MNNQLRASTKTFERLTMYGTYYALATMFWFLGGFILFRGVLSGVHDINADRAFVIGFPGVFMCANAILMLVFSKVDKIRSVGDIGRTRNEVKIHSLMGKFKIAMATVFLFAMYQTAKMNLFGVDIYSFAPEIHFWFNNSYSSNAYNLAKNVFMGKDLDAYFTVLYSLVAAYLTVGAVGYYVMKIHADLIHKAFYYKSIRLAH